jgi:hypothetical protein
MQNSLAGRDCSHGQDLVAAEQYANLGPYRLLRWVALSLDQRSDSQYPPFDVPYGKTADGQVFMRSVAVARISQAD